MLTWPPMSIRNLSKSEIVSFIIKNLKKVKRKKKNKKKVCYVPFVSLVQISVNSSLYRLRHSLGEGYGLSFLSRLINHYSRGSIWPHTKILSYLVLREVVYLQTLLFLMNKYWLHHCTKIFLIKKISN